MPELPMIQAGWGLKTPFGILMPPGGKVAAYVRSTGAQDGDDVTIGANLVTTLAAGLARCRSGKYDTVFVLPGHSEAVTTGDLSAMVAGTRVIGVGDGATKPIFTWGATTSQWAIAVNDCTFAGLKLVVSGAVVVKGIYVTGANTKLLNNEIVQASGASLKATILLELDTGADNFLFADNWVYGTATHNSTDVILVTAAVSQCRIIRNVMTCSATAAKGLIHYVGASLNNYCALNDLENTHTASTACIAADAAASTGMLCNNNCSTQVGTGTAPAACGVVLTANCLMRAFNNMSCPTAALSGILSPAADS